MKIDIENLSLKDLKELRGKVDKAITGFEARKKREALAQLEETAKKLGFSLAELTGGKPGRKAGATRGKVAPKYANPKNKAETWTGRGRRPRWVEAALAAGKSLDDMRI